MNVHPLSSHPPAELSQALTSFEAQFTYPLGPGRFFRISHGDDYPRFFRAMGEAACFAAERHGVVLGTLGAALRCLLLPAGQERLAIYLGDLKITPAARGGRTLVRLARSAEQWARARTDVAFSVVMDGTAATPERYTGRLGLPLFRDLGKTIVLRLPTKRAQSGAENLLATTDELGSACYRRLSAGRYGCPGGDPAERSQTLPLWLMTSDGRACGRLEDTCRAKRLIADDGKEMRSAHLSCFAFQDAGAVIELLQAALCRAAGLGFPALFAAVAPPDLEAVLQGLGGSAVVTAPATIYGTGLEPGPLWNVNTAEI